MTLKAYENLVACNIERIRRRPSHWSEKRLKHVTSVFPSNVDKHVKEGEQSIKLCNYTDVYYNNEITDRLSFMEATATPAQIEKFKLREGQTIITKDSETADDIGVPSYVPKNFENVICGYHLTVIQPSQNIVGKFVSWYFRSAFLRAVLETRANGLTRVGLSQYSIDNLEILVPPMSEQEMIVEFLDHETAKIDALIAEQKRLIELLKEKRQAVISHAVTKGLNPNVEMKDSGVEWIGQVPSHWSIGALRWYADIQGGLAKGKSYGWDEETEELPYLRVANVQSGHIDLTEVHTVEVSVREISRYRLKSGDVLMNEGGDNDKLGRGAVWHGEIELCLHQNHVFAIRPTSALHPDWLAVFTQSESARAYFYLYSKQSTNLASISASNIMGCPVPIPPCDEQKETLENLSFRLNKLDALVGKIELQMKLLSERRSALVSAAVTGKIDVRNWKSSKQTEAREATHG